MHIASTQRPGLGAKNTRQSTMIRVSSRRFARTCCPSAYFGWRPKSLTYDVTSASRGADAGNGFVVVVVVVVRARERARVGAAAALGAMSFARVVDFERDFERERVARVARAGVRARGMGCGGKYDANARARARRGGDERAPTGAEWRQSKTRRARQSATPGAARRRVRAREAVDDDAHARVRVFRARCARARRC